MCLDDFVVPRSLKVSARVVWTRRFVPDGRTYTKQDPFRTKRPTYLAGQAGAGQLFGFKKIWVEYITSLLLHFGWPNGGRREIRRLVLIADIEIPQCNVDAREVLADTPPNSFSY